MPDPTSEPAPDAAMHGGADGQLVDVDGRSVVRFVRHYPSPPTEVWSAITESERVGRWAFPVEFEPRTGGRLRFDFGEGGSAEGTVIAWDEPRVLEYQWFESEDMWHIRFVLAADDGGGTTLTFDHFLPDPARPEFAAGWHWHLDRLAMLVAGTTPPRVDSDAHFDALLAEYEQRMAGGTAIDD